MRLFCPLILALTLVGCAKPGPVVEANEQASAHEAPAIAWHDGTIDEAFAEATAANRPLFLYWGAVWCPPCQEIKHTVFESREFINLSRLFVPVYLDGDTARAQAWGDRFAVKGYPTMIVFNPAGQEVTRIPGGIDISRYNSVLAMSLEQMTPTAELVAQAVEDPSALSERDFSQLAYYSWGQDDVALPDYVDEIALFDTLARHAPAGELSARFYMNYLVSNLDNENGEPGEISFDQLERILASDELTLACWDTLAYYFEDLLPLATTHLDPPRAVALEEKWVAQLYKLRFAPALSTAEKLAGWLPRLQLLTPDDQPLPEPVADELRAELRSVDEATPDRFERQSVVNQMSHLLREAGLRTDAEALLLAELKRSAAPYYFMSGLSVLAEQAGRIDEAIDWRRQAFESSTGEATRFQWGVNYVQTMIRLAPADQQAISQTAADLLAAFDDSAELFAGRNFRGLQRLDKALVTWEAGRRADGEEIQTSFRTSVSALCVRQIAGSPEEKNCQSLVAESALANAG